MTACAASPKTNGFRFIEAIALLVFGLASTVGVFKGGSFAAIGIVGAVLLWLSVAIERWRLPLIDEAVFVFVFGALAVMEILDFRAAWPPVSWFETLRLASFFLPLMLLSVPRVQERVAESSALFKAWPWLLAAGMLMLGIECGAGIPFAKAFLSHGELELARHLSPEKFTMWQDHLMSRYNRGVSYGFLLAWPVAAYLWMSGRRRELVVFVLCLVPALVFTTSRASQLAAMVGGGVLAVAFVAPGVTRWALGAVAVVGAAWPVAAHWVFLNHPAWVAALPTSWHHRLEIWDFMSRRIAERPWGGWGLGSSHNLSLALHQGGDYIFATESVGHPHNVFTQLWVELGVPGLVLGVAFGLLMLIRAGRLPKPMVPFALGAWAAAFIVALVAYNFWADSLWAVFALAAFGFAVAAVNVNLSLSAGLQDSRKSVAQAEPEC